MDRKEDYIAVFDSGVGGLTVAREIMRQIPNEKIIYFGDTARVPYGSKSKETVTRFSKQIVRFLQSHQVKTIVVACNTASAYALDELEKEIEIPIIVFESKTSWEPKHLCFFSKGKNTGPAHSDIQN